MNKKRQGTYTYIFEYRGGTYCSQVEADSLNDSLFKWVEKLTLEIEDIKYLSIKGVNQIKETIKLKNNIPVNITGMTNVWFNIYTIKSGSLFLNIVKTVKENECH